MNQKISKHLKRAFSTIEMIVLITIVAVLGATIVMAIDHLSKKPETITNTVYVHPDEDFLTIDAINKAILQEDQTETVHELLQKLEKHGYHLERLKPKNNNYEYVYLRQENVFGVKENDQVIYPKSVEGQSNHPNIWRFVSTSPTSGHNHYSYYLLDECEGAVVLNGGGLDVGRNEDISTITYTNTTYNGDVLIRTNSPATSLTVNTNIGGIIHYGHLGILGISRLGENHYYVEHGHTSVAKLRLVHVVVEEPGLIDVAYPLSANVVLQEKTGLIDQAYCVSNEIVEVSGGGYNGYSQQHGGNVFINYSKTNEQINAICGNYYIAATEGLNYPGVVIINEKNERQILTLEHFRSKVSQSNTFKGCTVKLLSDINFETGDYWTPIDYFAGTFNGNGYAIRNLQIRDTRPTSSVGLFGIAGEGIRIENVQLYSASINATGENSSVGGLIGLIRGKYYIRNCSIDLNSVITGGYVGGMIGQALSYVGSLDPQIEFVYCGAHLMGNVVGGIIGMNKAPIVSAQLNLELDCMISNCVFEGRISTNGGENCAAGGIIGAQEGGNPHCMTKITNVQVFDENIVTEGYKSSLIGISAFSYAVNGALIGSSLVNNPADLDGYKNVQSLVVGIYQDLYVFETPDDVSIIAPLTKEVSVDQETIVCFDDEEYLILNPEDEAYGCWNLIDNLDLSSGKISFKNDLSIGYIGYDPTLYIDEEKSKVQQCRYAADYDDVNEQDIYKFDKYRIVDLETESDEIWMDELVLGPGEYFDNPIAYVNLDIYMITMIPLGDDLTPEEPEEPEEEEQEITPEEEEGEDEEEEIIYIYVVSPKLAA